MSDLTTQLRHASYMPSSGPDLASARRRARNEHRLRLGTTIGSAVVVLALIVAAVTTQDGGDGSRHTLRASALRAITVNDPAGSVTFQLPAGWQQATSSLTPSLINPHELTALGTFPLHVSDHTCAHVPVNALEDMTDTDALIWMSESLATNNRPADQFEPRPTSFGPTTGRDASGGDVTACMSHPLAGTARIVGFEESGRQFQVIVAIGSETSPERRAQAYAILDSLKVG